MPDFFNIYSGNTPSFTIDLDKLSMMSKDQFSGIDMIIDGQFQNFSFENRKVREDVFENIFKRLENKSK